MCINYLLKQAWKYLKFLTDSEGEAAETQVWLDYALACKYIDEKTHHALDDKYDHILAMLLNMAIDPGKGPF
jgi:four helix bundle protein